MLLFVVRRYAFINFINFINFKLKLNQIEYFISVLY